MTQTAPFQRRFPSSPHASKSKSTRPALHRRGTSSANVSISKLGSGQKGASKPPTSTDDIEFEMASFLNFWYVINPKPLIFESCRDHFPRMPVAVICVPYTDLLFNGHKADPIPVPCVRTKLPFPTTLYYIVAKGM